SGRWARRPSSVLPRDHRRVPDPSAGPRTPGQNPVAPHDGRPGPDSVAEGPSGRRLRDRTAADAVPGRSSGREGALPTPFLAMAGKTIGDGTQMRMGETCTDDGEWVAALMDARRASRSRWT